MITVKDTNEKIPIPVALGNPFRARGLREKIKGNGDIRRRGYAIYDGSPEDNTVPYEATTSFWYQADDERYETGYHITVQYHWNDDPEEEYCIENSSLICDNDGRGMDIDVFRNGVLPKITDLHPFTHVMLKTTNANIEVTNMPVNMPECKAYIPIPDSIAATIPRIRLSSLRMCPVETLSNHVDIVTRAEDLGPTLPWYAFKRYAIPMELQQLPMDTLLSELQILVRLNSPHIIKPTFVVIDDSEPPLFRGYLTPFMPAGPLSYVFAELRAKDKKWRKPMFLHPNHLKCYRGRDDNKKPALPQLPWKVKHDWAIEATMALVTLHANAVYSGDVKLQNIILDRDGHLQFIDVAPQPGFTPEYIAPEVDVSRESDDPLPLTEARDIFAFGLVLWQIAEEECKVKRTDNTTLPKLNWRSDRVLGSTPAWYQGLVRRCIDINPTSRPSAKDILDILKSKI